MANVFTMCTTLDNSIQKLCVNIYKHMLKTNAAVRFNKLPNKTTIGKTSDYFRFQQIISLS